MPRQHHPIADLFPMLAEDELRELAADIKQRGQLQPIMLDDQGRILDGRNRNAACDLAGVEPWFEAYEGDDPDGYALAVNVNRRNLNKGQAAMIAADADFLMNKKYGEQKRSARLLGVSDALFSQAKTIRKFAPELVPSVIAKGNVAEAYQTAKQRKDAVKSREAKLDELRKLAPDLAVLVDNEIRDLDDALEEAKLRAIVREIDEARNADGAPPPTFAQRAEDGSITWDEAETLAKQWQQERADAIRRAQNGAVQLVNHWGVIQTIRDQLATPYVADILAGLGETDRAAIDRIITELKG